MNNTPEKDTAERQESLEDVLLEAIEAADEQQVADSPVHQ